MRKVMFHINSDSATFDNIAVPSGSGSANRLAATYFIGFPSLSAKAHVKKLTPTHPISLFHEKFTNFKRFVPSCRRFFQQSGFVREGSGSGSRSKTAGTLGGNLALWAAITVARLRDGEIGIGAKRLVCSRCGSRQTDMVVRGEHR
jgi:hypothetical protein